MASVGVLIPLIFFTSWLLSRRLTRPIMRLVQADRAIIQGDPSRAFISDHEIPADELGEVMHIRNIMLTSLKENEKQTETAAGRTGTIQEGDHTERNQDAGIEGQGRNWRRRLKSCAVCRDALLCVSQCKHT